MFHRQSSNSIKQLMWLQICYMYLYEHASLRMKDTPRQKMVGLPPRHFLETLPSWSPSQRQIMVAAPTSHMIRFGPLTFRPVKGKKQQQMNCCTGFKRLERNLRFTQQFWNGNKSRGHSHDLSRNHSWPKCSHQSIAPAGQRKIDRKIRLRQKLRPPTRSKRSATLDIVISPGFLTVRYLFILSA